MVMISQTAGMASRIRRATYVGFSRRVLREARRARAGVDGFLRRGCSDAAAATAFPAGFFGGLDFGLADLFSAGAAGTATCLIFTRETGGAPYPLL